MEELRTTASAELYYRITPARDHESSMPAEGKTPRPTLSSAAVSFVAAWPSRRHRSVGGRKRL